MHLNKNLLKDCKKNKEAAQRELYRVCFNTLMSIANRYSNNRQDAVSLVNLGFLKIITNLGKYKEAIPFKSWISRVMINSIIDEYRKSKKYRENILLSNDGSLDNYEEHLQIPNLGEQDVDAEELLTRIRALPEVTGKVFNLYAIDGYNHREIAGMLKISEGTSKWHLHFARKKLKHFLATTRRLISLVL